MRRREFIAILGAAVWPLAAQAQPYSRRVRIATLDDAREGALAEQWQYFRDRLRQLGYVEGKNLAVNSRSSQGDQARLPDLAAELIALKPDVIVASTTPATRAVMRATSSLPIVFLDVAEPVETGIVASLAHPGGNATGQAIVSAELSAKWLEILVEIAPKARKFAFLGQAANPAIMTVFRSMQKTANAHNLSARLLEVTTPQEVERAFEVMVRENFDAFMVASAPLFLPYRQQIVDLAARHRLPAVYARVEYVAAGGLLSYSPDRNEMFRRAADYVHRILQGTKPADLPVEQPMRTQLVVNLKTAKALGLTIPQSILVRADRVIE